MKRLFFLLCTVCTLSVFAAEQISIKQFLENADGATTYRLRGEVQIISNSTYGNFYLRDKTGVVYIYNLLDGDGYKGKFSSMDIEEGDTLTLEGNWSMYKTTVQVKEAQYIEHTKSPWMPVEISLSELITRDDGKRYILKEVVSDIGTGETANFTIADKKDNSITAYVYNILSSTGFLTTPKDLGLENGDTITLNGCYQLYGSTPEIVTPQYISHKHPGGGGGGGEDKYQKVDFATDFADGWDSWIGKTVEFTNDFYLLNTYSTVAYKRLRNPEEYGEEGTDAYTEAETHNSWAECYLSGISFNYTGEERPGTIIRGLQATVTSANNMKVVNSPEIIPNGFPTERPDMGKATLVVCGANIENFFVSLDLSYAAAKSEEELMTQKTKISKALYNIDADIYGICEMEEGPLAVTELVNLMNELAGKDQYAWVDANYNTYNSIMVCYIYRKDKVKTYGKYLEPYSNTAMKYREAIQCFEEKKTHERFNLSVNHFYAKLSKTDEDRQDNMNTLIAKLKTARSNDPDVLVIGDLNAYSQEESNLLLVRDNKYVDLLMKYEPDGYSYLYNERVGYLDHAYANNSMSKQVTKACAYHLNADTYKNGYKFQSGNTTMYRYADHDPILVGLKLYSSSDDDGIENIEGEVLNAYKVIIDGHLYIINNGIRYTVTGQRAE